MKSIKPFLLGLSLMFAVVLSMPSKAGASHWPQFRGPGGLGVADAEKPPTEFGPEQNVKWKTAIAGGASSPCVWDDRIFLTTFDQTNLETICVNAESGELLWKKAAAYKELELFHPRESSPASATPATDGRRVVSYFGSYGLLCYNIEGETLWTLPLPVPRQVGDFGSGCSPIIANGLVFLNRDQITGSELLAVNLETGAVVWRADRSYFGSGWSTPVIWNEGNEKTLVLAGGLEMRGYHPSTGALRWQVKGLPAAVCTTPVSNGDTLYFAGWSPGQSDSPMPPFQSILDQNDRNNDGVFDKEEAAGDMKSFFASFDSDKDDRVTKEEWNGFIAKLSEGKNSVFALKAGGQGLLTEDRVAWRQLKGLPYVPSPLHYRDRIYLVKDGGLVSSYDSKTGEPVLEQERLGAIGSYYASPVAADGRIYAASTSGRLTVFKAQDTLSVVSTTNLDERLLASPAIANNAVFVRTDEHLWAFADQSIPQK